VFGGGDNGQGGWATTPPPQAGRVTDSDGGGCERSSATLSNEQFILKPSHKEWKEIYLFHS